jgi:putative component of membrane protein insertase Oxa1/YidC/SpoIIIJ protein YidD
MQTPSTLPRQAAASLINIYQRYISPRKGFSCAHRILHQGESCSQYTKQIILSHGPKDGLGLIRQRFRDCKAAHLTLRQLRSAQIAQIAQIGPQSRPQKALVAVGLGPDQISSAPHRPEPAAPEPAALDPATSEPATSEPTAPEPTASAHPRRRRKHSQTKNPQTKNPQTKNSISTNSSSSNSSSGHSNGGHNGPYCDLPIGSCSDVSEGANCIPELPHCGASQGCAPELGGLDCGGLDCGGADCGGADCGGGDVGSC